MYRGTTLTMTNAGRNLIARAQAGETVSFTRFGLGSGYTADFAALTALVSGKLFTNVQTLDAGAGIVSAGGYYRKADVTTAFVWKEFGIYGKAADEQNDYLCAYSYDAQGDTTISPDDVLDVNEIKVSISVADADGSFGEIAAAGLVTLATFNAALALKANASHTHTPEQAGAAPAAHVNARSTAGAYGHAKASGTTPKANGTASVGAEADSFARGDHVHPAQTTITGNAGTATKLQSARTVTATGDVNFSFTFDGSGNVSVVTGYAGTVPVAKGGTGGTTAAAARTNLGAAAVQHTHSMNDLNGALPVSKGGTGGTTAAAAAANLGYLANMVIYSAETPAVVNGKLWLKPIE